MIGLPVTGEGIPVTHMVFDGNTADSATMPDVLADLQDRFGVGRIALAADRGLISPGNLTLVTEAGPIMRSLPDCAETPPSPQSSKPQPNKTMLNW
ncbi:MAG: hypothetical protein GY708_18140 [Actinomycetia bacterium]|nr:hypothetical protein [Actinomycetes bacterium]